MDTSKRGRGRPTKSVLERKVTGIAFLDLVRPSPLPWMLDIAPAPCEMCQYHALIGEAQRLLRIVHENNLRVFRRYRRGGKRGLVPDLMAPWLDEAQPYPFNLDPESPGRYVPTGSRNPWEVEVKASDLGIEGEAVEWESGGGRYKVEFDTDSAGNRVLESTTRVYIQDKEAIRNSADFEEPPSGLFLGNSWDSWLLAREGWRPVATFGKYVKSQMGKVTQHTFESRDLHDRMVAIRLVKEAQEGNLSAKNVVLNACRPVVEKVAAEFREWAMSQRKAQLGGVTLGADEVQFVAKEIGKVLILGTCPCDLPDLLKKIDQPRYANLPLNRTLDRLLRYHIEIDVYTVSWGAILTTLLIHEEHAEKVDDPEKATLYRRMGATLSMLRGAFDPYTWMNDQRVFDVTSEAARTALRKAYQGGGEGGGPDLLERAVAGLPAKYGVQFSDDAYDPRSGETLVEYLRKRLNPDRFGKLMDWFRAEFPQSLKKQRPPVDESDEDEIEGYKRWLMQG